MTLIVQTLQFNWLLRQQGITTPTAISFDKHCVFASIFTCKKHMLVCLSKPLLSYRHWPLANVLIWVVNIKLNINDGWFDGGLNYSNCHITILLKFEIPEMLVVSNSSQTFEVGANETFPVLPFPLWIQDCLVYGWWQTVGRCRSLRQSASERLKKYTLYYYIQNHHSVSRYSFVYWCILCLEIGELSFDWLLAKKMLHWGQHVKKTKSSQCNLKPLSHFFLS